jgi:release factor glutamine methyltransferase
MNASVMSVEFALAWAAKQLVKQSSTDSPENLAVERQSALIDARYLVSYVMDKNFTWLKTWSDTLLSEQQTALLVSSIKRRKTGEPIAYITGEKSFWSLTLKTNSSTLIPRAETELLVEETLAILEHRRQSNTADDPDKTFNILDLGTGTGAIALSLAVELPTSRVYGCDYQQAAVELAIENAKLNKLSNAEFFQSDWFSQVPAIMFDAVVANPPYVEAGDSHLEQGDLVFEPNSALVAKDQGLADIKLIVANAKKYLNSGAPLLLEHGYNQGEVVRNIFNSHGYSKIKTIVDLDGNDRVTLGY